MSSVWARALACGVLLAGCAEDHTLDDAPAADAASADASARSDVGGAVDAGADGAVDAGEVLVDGAVDMAVEVMDAGPDMLVGPGGDMAVEPDAMASDAGAPDGAVDGGVDAACMAIVECECEVTCVDGQVEAQQGFSLEVPCDEAEGLTCPERVMATCPGACGDPVLGDVCSVANAVAEGDLSSVCAPVE